MTGNICCKYEYYREYVITVLPQLKELDGEAITTSERLEAKRIFEKVENAIERQSELYLEIRERQKFDYERKAKTTGDEFWNEEDEDSPENRRDMRIEATRQKEENKDHKPMFEKPDVSYLSSQKKFFLENFFPKIFSRKFIPENFFSKIFLKYLIKNFFHQNF